MQHGHGRYLSTLPFSPVFFVPSRAFPHLAGIRADLTAGLLRTAVNFLDLS
jgi:hypothetical protein